TSEAPGRGKGRIINKRGLFDLGGMILGEVFGLASSGDIEAVKRKFTAIYQATDVQDKMIDTQNKVLQDMLHHLRKTRKKLKR
ncbi:hypothetical protein SMA88_24425, partial [Escherichia coli]|uniref:hypothetical protein n=1 Tax=Escherichia coli TaxID=562 RepID=UPI00307A2782